MVSTSGFATLWVCTIHVPLLTSEVIGGHIANCTALRLFDPNDWGLIPKFS